MQLTAYSIHEFWKKGIKDFFIYELTKTNKVIVHSLVDLIEFDECILMKIVHGEIKHRLMFLPSNTSKKILGDSVFFTDFAAIKSWFQLKVELATLKEDIEKHKIQLNASLDHLNSKIASAERLELGLSDKHLRELNQQDEKRKNELTQFLKNTIYAKANRYGSDVPFTFLVDRLWSHSNVGNIDKEVFIKSLENETCERLNERLNLLLSK